MALLGTLVATPAVASPRADPTSGRAVFTGPTSVHPTSVLVNPAAIGLDALVRLYAAVTMVATQESVDRRLEDEAGRPIAGPSLSDSRTSLGGELAAVWHPAQRISVGAALRTAPAETFFSASGASYHGQGGQQRDIAATVAGTLQVSSIFYVGAALSLSRASLNLRFARDVAPEGGSAGLEASCGDARCGLSNPLAAERYDVQVGPSTLFSNQNLALSLGLILKVGNETFLGLSYHTPPGFSVQSQLVGSATVTRAAIDGGERLSGDASVEVSYPASVEAGLRTPLGAELQLISGVRWEDTSRMAGYDVRPHGRAFAGKVPEWLRRARGLHDAVALWAGVEQLDRGRPWTFGGRLGFELASIDDAKVAPGNDSTNSVTLDLGVQWRVASAPWALQLGYGLAYFLPLSVGTSSYSARNLVDCVDNGYDYASSSCRAVRNGYGIETTTGDYRTFQHAVRLGARYEF